METNIFYLMTQFWHENEQQPFSSRETQLYFYLLAEHNRQRRQNPFGCSTRRITSSLGLSKQTLSRLRKKLQERGLLVYEKGKNQSAVPRYMLILNPQSSNTDPQDGTQDGTPMSRSSNTDTQNGTQDGTPKPQGSITDPQDGTIIKSNKSNIIINNIYKEKFLSLEELKAWLLNDTQWKGKVKELARARGFDVDEKRVGGWLEEFFLYLQTCGTQTKSIGEAQRYFVNWMIKRANVDSKPSNGNAGRSGAPSGYRVGVKLTDNSLDKFKGITGWESFTINDD